MTVYGFDVSNYTAVPDPATLHAFCNSEHLTRILIASQFPYTFNTWYELARQEGLEVYSWLFLYNQDPRTYAQQILDNFAAIPDLKNTKKFYADIEDGHQPLPSETDILDALRVIPVDHGVYTGSWYWPMIGNPQVGRYTGLWDANYDNNPTDFSVNYGGWLRAECKQYAGDYVSYGMKVDLDSWDD